LSLDDVEDEVLLVQRDPGYQVVENNFSLVGCFLTASIVHFTPMKSTMANLWHLVRGVQISDLGDKRFIFKFFHKMDLDRVLNGALWTFNNHLLVFHLLGMGKIRQRMAKGVESIELGWDLSLHAQFRKAISMHCVWLVEDNDEGGFRSLNLEGGNDIPRQVGGFVDMEHDVESPIESGVEKKRPRKEVE
ncbi:hypothetical protein Gogos_010129, partial [Gossypium gossypioides]|nr:hypothetical protein [Gossypium gossypioides]